MGGGGGGGGGPIISILTNLLFATGGLSVTDHVYLPQLQLFR